LKSDLSARAGTIICGAVILQFQAFLPILTNTSLTIKHPLGEKNKIG
jgi:hypothetical protein